MTFTSESRGFYEFVWADFFFLADPLDFGAHVGSAGYLLLKLQVIVCALLYVGVVWASAFGFQ